MCVRVYMHVCVCVYVHVCVYVCVCMHMYMYICLLLYEKAVSRGGEREKGGHVLRDTTCRGLCVRVSPPHTSERRGGGGGCEQEGESDVTRSE